MTFKTWKDEYCKRDFHGKTMHQWSAAESAFNDQQSKISALEARIKELENEVNVLILAVNGEEVIIESGNGIDLRRLE